MQFTVNSQKLSGNVSELDAVSSSVYRVCSELGNIRVQQGIGGAAAAEVNRSLQGLGRSAEMHAVSIGKYAECLSTAVQRYQNAEQRICGGAASNPAGDNSGTSTVSATEKSNNETETNKGSSEWKKALAKGVGAFGIAGTVASTVLSIQDTGDPVKKMLTAAKGATKVVSQVADATENGEWLRRIVGAQRVAGSTTVKGFGANLAKEIGKYNFKNATSTAGKVKVVAKWGGAVLTALTKGYENFTDPENSFWRAALETVGETAVSIGKGMLITAGVAAVCAAIGFTGPAIVVAGIGVGVSLGVDFIFKSITGKDFDECVSDFVLDLPKNISRTVGDWAKKTGNAVSAAKKKISGWWNNMFGNPAPAV